MSTLDWSTTLNWSGLITPEKFNYLKEKVNDECKRRKHDGSLLNTLKEFEFTETPALNIKIQKEHYEKIVDQLSKINPKIPVKIVDDFIYEKIEFSTDELVNDGGRIVSGEELKQLEQIVNIYHDIPEQQNLPSDIEIYTGCAGSCSGLCGGGCNDYCTGCSDECSSDVCTATCAETCHGGHCSGECGSTCSYSGCTGSCGDACNTGCAVVCDLGCTDDCSLNCYTGCYGGSGA